MKRPFSSFILRTIALLAMTVDHTARMLVVFGHFSEALNIFYTIASIIGRIAFPIFIFLVIEGFVNTTNFKRYLLRMIIMTAIIYVGFVALAFIVPDLSYILLYLGNIFMDLTLYLVFFYFLFHNNKDLRPLCVLPFLYNVLVLLIQNLIIKLPGGSLVLNFAAGLLTQYSALNVLMMPLFVIIYYLFCFIRNKVKKEESPNYDIRTTTYTTRIYIYSILILAITLLCYLFTYYPIVARSINFVTQTYMIISLLFILLYNGKKGFSNKFIQSAYYLYYPVHLVIIFVVIFFLV